MSAVGVHPATGEIAQMLARVDDAVYAALDRDDRDRYDRLAAAVLDWVGQDDFHWGCVSQEAVDVARVDAFERAKLRITAGIARLVGASLVDEETARVVADKIRRMKDLEDA